MHRDFRVPGFSFLFPSAVLLAAFVPPSSAQPLPWALQHDGTVVQRFAGDQDNATACSVARAQPERRDQSDAWRCRVDLLPAVEPEHAGHATAPGELELAGAKVPVLVIGHSMRTYPVRYPPGSPMDGVDRSATLEIHVTADGSVERVDITRSTGDARMDAAAVEGARRWVYQPATIGGQPVAASVSIPVDFAGVPPPSR